MAVSNPVHVGTLNQTSQTSGAMTLAVTASGGSPIPADARLVVAGGWVSQTALRTITVTDAHADTGTWNNDHTQDAGGASASASHWSCQVTADITANFNITITPSGTVWGLKAIVYYITGVDHAAHESGQGGNGTSAPIDAAWTTGNVNPVGESVLCAAAIADIISATGGAVNSGTGTQIHTIYDSGNQWHNLWGYSQRAGTGNHAITGTWGSSGQGEAVSAVAYAAAAEYTGDYQAMRPDADLATTGWSGAPIYNDLNDESDSTITTGTLA